MSLSGIFARVVALIGDAAILWRRLQGGAHAAGRRRHAGDPGGQAAGPHPDAQDADGPGLGAGPDAGRGARAARSTPSRPASSIPRWIHVLPNGDVLVAEALFVPGGRQRRSSTTPWSAR